MILPSQDSEMLDTESSQRLHKLVDQPYSPLLKNHSGPRLKAGEIAELERYTRKDTDRLISPKLTDNDWIEAFIDVSLTQVPFYRDYSDHITSFADFPTICRGDLSQDIARFVPDNLPIDRLIAYETSGTTGHPLIVPSHPTVAAKYSCYHKKALAWNGVDCDTLRSELAIILAGYQENCFTYASISPYLNNKGLAKLNFHPNDWHHPDDRQRFLDRTRPDLISGDPISLTELAKLDFKHRPRAVLTTSMTLLEGCRIALQQRFLCPIIDVYSLNETGPIGCSIGDETGFKLLQPGQLIEILNKNGQSAALGERGEITITSCFNDYLPLIRYRTGDFGRLAFVNNAWYVTDLEGRSPVQFKTAQGEWLNNVDITHALNSFALPQFSLHQHSNGQLTLTLPPVKNADEIRRTLCDKLGYEVECQPIENTSNMHKMVQYSSDLNGG